MGRGEVTRAELLAFPHREWASTEALYDRLYIFPSGEQHDSGFACLAIVGHKLDGDDEAWEVISMGADHLMWHVSPREEPLTFFARMHMDCTFESETMQAYRLDEKTVYRVGAALSSIDIYVEGVEG